MKLEQVVAQLVQQVEQRFYGKYRGFVVDNADPEQLGRLKLRVPSILGNDVVTGWATPCVPSGGSGNQGFLAIPAIGAGVWVEFEEGDLEFPIWVGTFWSKPGGTSELPVPNTADGAEESAVQDPPTRTIIKTQKGHTIQFEDKDGAEMITLIEATHGHVITLNVNGISITDGANNGNQIVMDPSGVTVASSGTQIILSATGVQVGGSAATEPFVLGNQFLAQVNSFLTALSTHTHVGNMGAPTSPPVAPMQLQVPLSTSHMVE